MNHHSNRLAASVTRWCGRVLSVLFILLFGAMAARADWPNDHATKWVQYPDTNGLDVLMRTPLILADDFLCTNSAPITDIHLWTSWLNDELQMGVPITLSIWSDVPANPPNVPFSHPGTRLWEQTFLPGPSPGQYQIREWTNVLNEQFWTPDPPPQGQFLGFDHIIWQYNFYPTEPFEQQGTPQNPLVYWLAVTVPATGVQIGWKTSTNHWNDDAVCGHVDQGNPVGDWWELRDPREPTISLDLSFVLTTKAGTNDFGDAPDSLVIPGYPTLLANNGARHRVLPGLFLGTLIDTEWDGQPNPAATGDDTANLADEDGVVFVTPLILGQNATINVFASQGQLPLNAWIDFGADGSWLTAGDQIALNLPTAAPPNPTVITFLVPPAAVAGSTYARFRFSTMGGLAPTGPAPNGEVEDYRIQILQQQPTDDFGDAPDNPQIAGYPTLLINGGAQHTVVAGIFMGNLIDAEPDGQPNASATGDDLAGLMDEDGVALLSPIVPGQVATVNVAVPVAGFLSAWMDFNADGSWATPGDQIFNNLPLTAGGNMLTFNVPFPVAQGSNTFARFRFCTVSGAVTTFTGPAPDGEVEDYQWRIEELDLGDAQEPTFPTTYANNGARHLVVPTIFLGARIDSEADGQPNATATGDDNNPPFALSDEDGVTLLTPLVPGQPANVQVVTTMLGGLMNAPLNAWIDFDADGSWATPGDQICVNTVLTPGVNVVNFIVPPTAAAGGNVFARFRFSTMPSPPLTDAGFAPNGEVEDYLWRIERLDFGDAPDPAYPTRLANNGAHHLPGNLFLGATVDAEADGQPNAFATGDDLAGADDEDGVVFNTAIISGVPATVNVTCSAPGLLQGWIDWNQNGSWAEANEQIIANAPVVAGLNTVTFFVPNILPSGKTFARFRLSTTAGLGYTGYAADGEVEDYEVTLYPLKWTQPPEQGIEGVDVSLGTPLADDFICGESGPITDVHIWGSFFKDALPAGGPGSLTLTLTIYADVPAPPYSQPGPPLWSKTFSPGQYQAANNFTTLEWWHDPAAAPPANWIPNADTNMYQFDFYIDPREAFVQEEGTIYWLGVSNNAAGGANVSFGWKTTYLPWNDAACWLDITAGGIWKPMFYGDGHPWADDPPPQNWVNLAFALSGVEELFDSDFGDAPNPYPTLAASGGAQHYAVPGFRLGPAEDTEADGLPHPQALGDDLNNLADEDGVVFTPPVLAGTQACVTVSLTGPAGRLDAWVDFNKNGVWDHPAEQVFASLPLISGPNPGLCFNVPTNAVLGTNFARFRLSSAGGLTPTGLAADGEVEDHLLVILQRKPLTNIVITNIWATNVNANTQLVNLAWTYENDVHYQVRYAPNLGSNYVSNIFWIDLGREIIGPAHQYQDIHSNTVPQRFYRVVAPYLAP